jgi:hypothetical protein
MKRAQANLKAWREYDKVHGLVMVWIENADGTFHTLNSHTYEADAEKQAAEWEPRYPGRVKCERLPLEKVYEMVAASVSIR